MMKTFALTFVILLSQTPLRQQTLPEWFRVYTFDDSIIELNTTYVMFSGQHTGRVRFRWSFQKPQTLSGEPDKKYQSRLEEIECDCRKERFRLHSFQLHDVERKVIRAEEIDPPGEWRVMKSGGVMKKLFAQACRLIELRRRVPVSER